MSTMAWVLILVFAAAAAFLIGWFIATRTGRLKHLQQERDGAKAELQRYQEEVNTHFEKTAHLFNEVTGSYRSLYEHLAVGSERLGVGPASALLTSRPEQRQLPEQPLTEKPEQPTGTPPTATDKAHTPASQQAAEQSPHKEPVPEAADTPPARSPDEAREQTREQTRAAAAEPGATSGQAAAEAEPEATAMAKEQAAPGKSAAEPKPAAESGAEAQPKDDASRSGKSSA